MDKTLLDIICCPVTHSQLAQLSSRDLKTLNSAISAGDIASVEGKAVNEPLSAALVTRDGKRVYPIRDGIPILLEEEGLNVAALDFGLS